MHFHSQKCQTMHITNKRNIFQSTYTIHNHNLQSTNTAKYLGIHIDSTLKWNTHINKTAQRANTTSAFLHRNIRTCPRKIKHLAYTTLVRPILEYASIIWDPHTDSNTLKLETVQRRSARRFMQNYNRHASVTAMLQHLDLPTLQQRRRHSKIIMLYRIIHQLANIPTTTYITPATRNTQHYNLPYARTDVYKSSFFPSTIKLWNNLLPAIINSTTYHNIDKHWNPHQHPVGAGQHLKLTSIIQLQYTNTLTSDRRGATISATYLGGHLTFTSIIQHTSIR